MQHRIPADQVRAGMYVCGFGGPWMDHPFWRTRFVLKSDRDVERIRSSGVPYVVIDDERGLGLPAAPVAPAAPAPQPDQTAIRRAISDWEAGDLERARAKSDRQRAGALVKRSLKVLRGAFADVRLGRAVRIAEVGAIVDDVVASVERSPRTLLDILRLKSKNEYTYLHSVAVCTLMVNAARYMGKSEAETRDYGMAGLLHDLGKMGIPDAILNKSGRLTDAEFAAVRDHPEHGYQVLSGSPNVPPMALDVCRHHHERIDGTGYPFGLPADAISLVARLGAVCDVYDALTSDRVYKDAWTPLETVSAMWSWEGHFDRDVLFTFMRSIGVFPPGLLVQLRSNRLAIVLESKRRQPVPRVLAFYATRDREFITPEELTLDDTMALDGIVALADPGDWGFDDWDGLAERLVNGDRSRIAA